MTAAYAPREGLPVAGGPTAPLDAQAVFARAAAHRDDHTITCTDTALDVGDATALVATGRSIELNPPSL